MWQTRQQYLFYVDCRYEMRTILKIDSNLGTRNVLFFYFTAIRIVLLKEAFSIFFKGMGLTLNTVLYMWIVDSSVYRQDNLNI